MSGLACPLQSEPHGPCFLNPYATCIVIAAESLFNRYGPSSLAGHLQVANTICLGHSENREVFQDKTDEILKSATRTNSNDSRRKKRAVVDDPLAPETTIPAVCMCVLSTSFHPTHRPCSQRH